MQKAHEQLLVAALAGLIIAGAAAYAVGPALSAERGPGVMARVSGIDADALLNVRMGPAPDAWTVGTLAPGSDVWVDRCTIAGAGPDWCLVESGQTHGWVNAHYLSLSEAI